MQNGEGGTGAVDGGEVENLDGKVPETQTAAGATTETEGQGQAADADDAEEPDGETDGDTFG